MVHRTEDNGDETMKDDWQSFVWGVCAGVVIMFLLAMVTGMQTRYRWERKAVEADVAFWVLDDGGSRILEWKTCEEAKP